MSRVNITENDMTNGEDFCFGMGFYKTKKFYWNPDKASNPHLIVWGTSGSGKTRIARKLAEYLNNRNKHIHIIDITGQDDWLIKGENYMKFSLVNSEFGIPLFDFDRTTIDSGGPKAQIYEVLDYLKKGFITKMGDKQKNILVKTFSDLYLVKGVKVDEPDTWGIGKTYEEFKEYIPSAIELRVFIKEIIEAVNTGYGIELNKIIKKQGKKLNEWQKNLNRYENDIETLKNSQTEGNKDKVIKEIGVKENHIADIQETIQEKTTELVGYFRQSLNYNYLGGDIPEFEKIIDDEMSIYSKVDLKYYQNAEVVSKLSELLIYVEQICESGAFGNNLPEVKAGLNRYDISVLPKELRVLWTDIFISRHNRAVRMRGKYEKLPLSYRDKRGLVCDSFIFIDEAKDVMPTGTNREDGKYGINKSASENRKWGSGLVIISQNPHEITKTVLRNSACKVGLAVDPFDLKDVKNFTNSKKDSSITILSDYKFSLMLKNNTADYETVATPWVQFGGLND